VFSPRADALVREIDKYLSRQRMWELLDWFNPPPLAQFEAQLETMLSRLKEQARADGWEPR
jgi:hypothetical protein